MAEHRAVLLAPGESWNDAPVEAIVERVYEFYIGRALDDHGAALSMAVRTAIATAFAEGSLHGVRQLAPERP